MLHILYTCTNTVSLCEFPSSEFMTNSNNNISFDVKQRCNFHKQGQATQ
jgi:hypothetical protein